VIARGFARQAELAKAIEEIKPLLGPDVVRLTYKLEEDWSGDPSIFFRVVLSDRASRRSEILAATRRVEDLMVDHMRPLEEWGLLPYYNYRSPTEQAARAVDDWA